MAVANNLFKFTCMQTINRFLIHPVTICLLFCCLIISGESTGGFYILYLLIGLPHGVLHSLLGTAGVVVLILSLYFKKSSVVASLGLVASGCFLLSLIRFFTQRGASYNYATFRQFVPLAILIVFLLCLLLFIFKQLELLKLRKSRSVSAV